MRKQKIARDNGGTERKNPIIKKDRGKKNANGLFAGINYENVI